MSDFLTNLAARTLQAAPVVRPRLAARFEAPLAGSRWLSGDLFGAEAEVPFESTNTAPPPAMVARPDSRDRAGSRRRDPAAPPMDSPAGLPADSVVPREQLVAKESSRVQSLNESRPAPPIAVQTIIERLAPSERVPRSNSRESVAVPSPHSPHSSIRIEENVADRPSSRVARGADAPTVVVPPRSEPISPSATKSATGREIIATPRVTPAPVSSPQMARRDPAPESAPTIHVTIGRIEVRAVTSSAAVTPPPSRTVAKSPVTSLDDYLRERSGGRK